MQRPRFTTARCLKRGRQAIRSAFSIGGCANQGTPRGKASQALQYIRNPCLPNPISERAQVPPRPCLWRRSPPSRRFQGSVDGEAVRPSTRERLAQSADWLGLGSTPFLPAQFARCTVPQEMSDRMQASCLLMHCPHSAAHNNGMRQPAARPDASICNPERWVKSFRCHASREISRGARHANLCRWSRHYGRRTVLDSSCSRTAANSPAACHAGTEGLSSRWRSAAFERDNRDRLPERTTFGVERRDLSAGGCRSRFGKGAPSEPRHDAGDSPTGNSRR
jgi:hypothetical protein